MGAMSGWEFFCALLLYPASVIDTHLKLKFIQLKSMDGKSIQCHLGLGFGKVIVNLNHGLISTSASSSLVLHLLPISGSSSSSPSSFVLFFGTRVFATRFFHQTQASKAWDVIFLIYLWFLLTNYIVWQTPAILKITSDYLIHGFDWWPMYLGFIP